MPAAVFRTRVLLQAAKRKFEFLELITENRKRNAHHSKSNLRIPDCFCGIQVQLHFDNFSTHELGLLASSNCTLSTTTVAPQCSLDSQHHENLGLDGVPRSQHRPYIIWKKKGLHILYEKYDYLLIEVIDVYDEMIDVSRTNLSELS